MERHFKYGPKHDYAEGDAQLLVPPTPPEFTVEGHRVFFPTPSGRAMVEPNEVVGVIPAGIGQSMLLFAGGSAVGVPIAADVVLKGIAAVPSEPSFSEKTRELMLKLSEQIRSLGGSPLATNDVPFDMSSVGATTSDAAREAASKAGTIPPGVET